MFYSISLTYLPVNHFCLFCTNPNFIQFSKIHNTKLPVNNLMKSFVELEWCTCHKSILLNVLVITIDKRNINNHSHGHEFSIDYFTIYITSVS